MTDDEALKILIWSAGSSYIQWDEDVGIPRWNSHSGGAADIMIDGCVTADELRALLHFAPTEE